MTTDAQEKTTVHSPVVGELHRLLPFLLFFLAGLFGLYSSYAVKETYDFNRCCFTGFANSDSQGFQTFILAWLVLSVVYLAVNLLAFIRTIGSPKRKYLYPLWLFFIGFWILNGLLYYAYSLWID